MKLAQSTKAISFLIIMSILMSGCASTTLFTTKPPGAGVYVKEKIKGTTPYKYSDTKIVFSSTPVTFKKEGYKDLNIVLKRNERLSVEAVISGLFLLYPLLWSAEYNETHFYELERIDTFKQDTVITAGLNIIPVTISDSIGVIQFADQMTDTISVGNLKEFADTSSTSQSDIGLDFTKRTISQFGSGIGICLKGWFFGLNYTFIGPKNWGTSISYNANPSRAHDIPSDYDRLFAPSDFVNVVSVNLLKAFPVPEKDLRFSIEAGPSWVNYSKAEIVPNAYYDPNYEDQSWFWDLWNGKTGYKYKKAHSRTSTIGASVMAKMEFLYAPSACFGLTIFTNINGLKTIAGFGCYINFGDVRD